MVKRCVSKYIFVRPNFLSIACYRTKKCLVTLIYRSLFVKTWNDINAKVCPTGQRLFLQCQSQHGLKTLYTVMTNEQTLNVLWTIKCQFNLFSYQDDQFLPVSWQLHFHFAILLHLLFLRQVTTRQLIILKIKKKVILIIVEYNDLLIYLLIAVTLLQTNRIPTIPLNYQPNRKKSWRYVEFILFKLSPYILGHSICSCFTPLTTPD